jgi:GlpG protein
MPEIDAGQLWRLVTPIFMHFSIAHILFNMWMLYDLGTLIERQMGSRWFVLLVLAIALPSNFAQYLCGPTGGVFGGMSGVVFGLFGYAWIRGRLDPTCGLYLRPDVVFWIMAWFGLCALGGTFNVGNVANWAHGGGLAAGVAIGYLAYRRKLFG